MNQSELIRNMKKMRDEVERSWARTPGLGLPASRAVLMPYLRAMGREGRAMLGISFKNFRRARDESACEFHGFSGAMERDT